MIKPKKKPKPKVDLFIVNLIKWQKAQLKDDKKKRNGGYK